MLQEKTRDYGEMKGVTDIQKTLGTVLKSSDYTNHFFHSLIQFFVRLVPRLTGL